MEGETNLKELIRTMKPERQPGTYVFCTVGSQLPVPATDIVMCFQEKEGYTIVVTQEIADDLNLDYSVGFAWITLTVHSSLAAVGFTATFSKALAEAGIGCNVVAAFHHDHLFVARQDAEKAINVLTNLPDKATGIHSS